MSSHIQFNQLESIVSIFSQLMTRKSKWNFIFTGKKETFLSAQNIDKVSK
jgi:hypothetical protein